MTETTAMFQRLLKEHSVIITDRQMKQFETYYHELVSWNDKMNLTAITEKEQVYIKHFFDSVSLSFFHPLANVGSIADIGSGAGFPSIPLKILFPHIHVTIIDSLKKRIGFLESLAASLQLHDVSCIHGRAEDIGRLEEHRERYDVVTARAVARLNVLAEFCLPFVRPQGYFIAMKGADPTEEIAEARFALKELGGRLEADHEFELPLEHSGRHMIVTKKIKSTPGKYPRKSGIPIKAPLLGEI